MPDGIYNNEPFTIIKREIMGGVPCYTIEYEKGGCQTLQEETLERYAPGAVKKNSSRQTRSKRTENLIFHELFFRDV